MSNNDKTTNNDSRETAVSFRNVVFSYNKDAKEPTIKNVSFDIYDGEYVCIIGGNGSGKSTISKILVGLLKPQSGDINIYKDKLSNITLKLIRRNVAIVFQNPDNQFIGLTPEDDIAFGLENNCINPTMMWDIIKVASSIVKIEHLLKFSASKLSGGQKQRVAIASALALNPKIIIFDESTSMLDATSKKEMLDLMLLLKKKYHKTIISITHDMEEIPYADKVIVVNKGEIERVGDPKLVFEDEEFLKKNKLNIPFALELSRKLREKNSKIDLTLDQQKLISNILSLCKN